VGFYRLDGRRLAKAKRQCLVFAAGELQRNLASQVVPRQPIDPDLPAREMPLRLPRGSACGNAGSRSRRPGPINNPVLVSCQGVAEFDARRHPE